MTAFANEVRKDLVLFSKFEVVDLDRNQLRPSQTTSEKHGENGMIAQVSQLCSRMYGKHLPALFNSQLIPDTNTQALRSFDPANASSEVRA